MVTTKPEFDFVFHIKKERYLVMSYLNNQLGYRDALLDTRSIIKKGDYIVLDPDGLVKNVVPGYENCDVTILGSPAMGATFADYLVHVHEGGKNTGIGGEGIESFLYVVDGELSVKNDDQSAELTKGGYIYSPASNNITFEAKGEATLYVYRRRYEPVAGHSAHTVVGNANDLEWMSYEGMDISRHMFSSMVCISCLENLCTDLEMTGYRFRKVITVSWTLMFHKLATL